MTKPPYPIACARCGGRVRWRRDDGGWSFPPSCSHCGARAEPGFKSIAVHVLDAYRPRASARGASIAKGPASAAGPTLSREVNA